jgi:hypothetical protein
MTLRESTAAREVFPAAPRAATATSAGVDLWNDAGRAQEALMLLSAGAASGTTPTLDVRIQHAHTDVTADYVDVPNGGAPQLTAAGFAAVDVRGLRRFVRVIATIGGGTPSFTFSAVLVFGGSAQTPI